MLLYLRSCLFYGSLVVWTLFCMLSLGFLWACPKSWWVKVGLVWIKGVLVCLKYTVGLDYVVTGQENIPEDEPCVIACQHQSVWETFVLPVLLKDVAIVLKKELLSIPVYGWFLKRMDMIPIDRGQSGRGWFAEARKACAQGRPVVIFPEGTRVEAGKTSKCRSGVYFLTHGSDLWTVPCVLDSGYFWPKHRFVKYPGTVRMHFCPKMAPPQDKSEYLGELEDLFGASQSLLKS